jgi:transaldolase
MSINPLLKLESFGQSVWIDFISRSTLVSGELKQLIERDGVSGVTSNPSIFEKAISGSHDYDQAICSLAEENESPAEIYQALTVGDIRATADQLFPRYKSLDGKDGYVSLEVSPHLAHDTARTVSEARRLWSAVDRPNLMIKVPGTLEGLPAIRQLIGEGINVNITLLFGLPRYRQVVEAYLAGLESLYGGGRPARKVTSVASFFLSRIDVLLDPQFEKLIQENCPEAHIVSDLHGQIAVHSAKAAYAIYHDLFSTRRWAALARQGATPQRLLWASTSTKNPSYSDVKYVEPLIGPDTINTMPLETLEAYRDHGQPANRLVQFQQEAIQSLGLLEKIGIDLEAVTQQLEDEGVEKFNQAYDRLLVVLEQKRDEAVKAPQSC